MPTAAAHHHRRRRRRCCACTAMQRDTYTSMSPRGRPAAAIAVLSLAALLLLLAAPAAAQQRVKASSVRRAGAGIGVRELPACRALFGSSSSAPGVMLLMLLYVAARCECRRCASRLSTPNQPTCIRIPARPASPAACQRCEVAHSEHLPSPAHAAVSRCCTYCPAGQASGCKPAVRVWMRVHACRMRARRATPWAGTSRVCAASSARSSRAARTTRPRRSHPSLCSQVRGRCTLPSSSCMHMLQRAE